MWMQGKDVIRVMAEAWGEGGVTGQVGYAGRYTRNRRLCWERREARVRGSVGVPGEEFRRMLL